MVAATDCAEAWPGGANPRLRSGAAAERSYPTTEERVGGWEVRGQGLRLGVPGCDKCIYPRPEVRGGGQEELPHVQGQGRDRECQAVMAKERPRGATPQPRRGAAAGNARL